MEQVSCLKLLRFHGIFYARRPENFTQMRFEKEQLWNAGGSAISSTKIRFEIVEVT